MTTSNQLGKLIRDLEKLKPSVKRVGPLKLPIILPKSSKDSNPDLRERYELFYLRSYQQYEPGLFLRLFKDCEGNSECEVKVREAYRRFEDNRWHESMDRLHNMFFHLDLEETEEFKEDFPHIIEAINEFAVIEGLREIKIE